MIDKSRARVIYGFMHLWRFRLLLLVMLLIGASVSVGLSFEDGADLLIWQAQAHNVRVNATQKPVDSVPHAPATPRASRPGSESSLSGPVSAAHSISILRC